MNNFKFFYFVQLQNLDSLQPCICFRCRCFYLIGISFTFSYHVNTKSGHCFPCSTIALALGIDFRRYNFCNCRFPVSVRSFSTNLSAGILCTDYNLVFLSYYRVTDSITRYYSDNRNYGNQNRKRNQNVK